MSPTRLRSASTWPWLALDGVAVVVFAAIGRAEHARGDIVSKALDTAWPFLVGLVVGWAVAYVAGRRRVPTGLGPGVLVVLCTVAIGMVVRTMTDRGTAVSFIIVTTVVLSLFMLGWRAIRHLIDRRATP